jgi:hypothetical protein
MRKRIAVPMKDLPIPSLRFLGEGKKRRCLREKWVPKPIPRADPMM